MLSTIIATLAVASTVRAEFGGPGNVRLTGGTATAGRVEVLYNGAWYGVCDDKFDNSEVNVVCSSLGLGPGKFHKREGLATVDQSTFGFALEKSYFPSIVFDDLDCSGSESSLHECPRVSQPNCRPDEIIIVECEATAECNSQIADSSLECSQLTSDKCYGDASNGYASICPNKCCDELPPILELTTPGGGGGGGGVTSTTEAPDITSMPTPMPTPVPSSSPTPNTCMSSVTQRNFIVKGQSVKATDTIFLKWEAPLTFTDNIDIILIHKDITEGRVAPKGMLDSISTPTTNLTRQGAGYRIRFRLLSKTKNGDYSLEVVMKPAGTTYADRFRPCNVQAMTFKVINEYISFTELSSTTPVVVSKGIGKGVKIPLKIRYFATSNVKFSITVTCFKPIDRRVGEFELCDGITNFVAQQPQDFGMVFGDLAEADYLSTNAVEMTLQVKLKSKSPTSNFKMRAGMGILTTDNKWGGIRDRTEFVQLQLTNV